ncbi:thioredoxin domain-containing protein [Pseudonocardia sp. NPDC046786]|uniref:thioredoxin domain-containing protein n=1 Tax=Pseudonocardia sp. NPDC046786 TaxID=3155471 RepID=UPI0033E49D17
MSGRLADATSPYLLQHADDPVDWWPWSDDAFADARRRDVPVLLSIGYAACHWCHVMARESFADPETARQINAGFVAIKVDREERPDVDAPYMAATQAMTGRGGWPLTCFLTPDGEPFHCGTYYPPTPRSGLPGFRQVLTAVTTAWGKDGARVREAATRITANLARHAAEERPRVPVGPEILDRAAATLLDEADPEHGGFGAAPKFPQALCLEFLLRHHERTGSARALDVVALTCERMARGGLYDQLAGGFARYTADAAWAVPHFEKMLHDNALLLRLYAHLARLTGSALAHRIATGTGDFLLTGMAVDGGLASALDADADGEEGLTYLWTPGQLIGALGLGDGMWAADRFGVTSAGTFGQRRSTLQLPADPDDDQRLRRVRAALLDARRRRPQPARDDKIVTAWNAMAAVALAEAGTDLGRDDWVSAAADLTRLLLGLHLRDGRLYRSSRHGRPGTAAGVLEDHAWLAEALLALHRSTGDPAWLDTAGTVLDLTLDRFADPDRPGRFHDTADDAAPILHRPRDLVDNATPCGSSALAGALLTASVLVDGERSHRYREIAEAALSTMGGVLAEHARFAGHWLSTAEALVHGPVLVTVDGDPRDPRFADLVDHARRRVPGGGVVVAGHPAVPDGPAAHRSPAAHVCRGFVCERPVGTVAELDRQLAGPGVRDGVAGPG